MSVSNWCNYKNDLYQKHLSTFNDIKITSREVDIISCVLHNRKEKKIAAILDISPRTVSNHVRNIMIKLGYNSRENIIDFAEKSGNLLYFKQYYFYLLVEKEFNKILEKISTACNQSQTSYNLIDCTNIDSNFQSCLNDNLKQAGCNHTQDANTKIVIIDDIKDIDEQKYSKPEYILILLGISDYDCEKIKYVKFNHDQEYYFSIIKLVQLLTNNENIKAIISSFQQEYASMRNLWDSKDAMHHDNSCIEYDFLIQNKIIIRTIMIIGALLMIVFGIKYYYFLVNNQVAINQSLHLPNQKILLDRSKILQEINDKFSQKNNIQIVTLVGIGGAGKTTTAREYAKLNGKGIVWEINARTKQTILTSLQNLTYALCQTPQEHNVVNQINEMKDSVSRENMMFSFLSKAFKTNPNWLLIYDNVNKFEDIMNYIPHDKNIWGPGRILITTVNDNISSNYNIKQDNIIHIEELSKNRSYDLFRKIIDLPNEEIDLCLKKIPPFPLDISIAAHYIKETNIHCNQYLEGTQKISKTFIDAQTNILKDKGDYDKTRYDIISTSVDTIINQSIDFKDLLFFISIIDHKHIPKDLLYSYKDQVTVDNFLHELKKFSIVASDNNKDHNSFSIHASTQEIILAIFHSGQYSLDITQNLLKIMECFNSILSPLINKSDINKMYLFTPHAKLFISYKSSLTDYQKSKLYKKLGQCYYIMAKHKPALDLLNKAYTLYQKKYGVNHIKTAKVLAQIAGIYRNMGDYIIAGQLFEKALPIYQKYYGINHEDTGWLNICLGGVYRINGEYKLAEKFLLEAQRVNKYLNNEINTAKADIYLALLYKALGRYTESIEMLQKARIIYLKYYGKIHPHTFNVSVRLAGVYRMVGLYNEASDLLNEAKDTAQKYYNDQSLDFTWYLAHHGILNQKLGYYNVANEYLQQSLSNYKRHLESDNIIIGWVKYHLACVQIGLKNYDKAEKLLNSAISIHNLRHKENRIKVAYCYHQLGVIKLNQQKLDEAIKYVKLSEDIFTKSNHVERYRSLELMADIKSAYADSLTSLDEKKKYYLKSVEYLKKALDIVSPIFPESSHNIHRLNFKYNSSLKKIDLST